MGTREEHPRGISEAALKMSGALGGSAPNAAP